MAVDSRGHPLFPQGFNSPTRFETDVYATLGGRRGALAAALLPQVALPAPVAAPGNNNIGDWHVDGMWGPRYAVPVPYLHADLAPDPAMHVASADLSFVP